MLAVVHSTIPMITLPDVETVAALAFSLCLFFFFFFFFLCVCVSARARLRAWQFLSPLKLSDVFISEESSHAFIETALFLCPPY